MGPCGARALRPRAPCAVRVCCSESAQGVLLGRLQQACSSVRPPAACGMPGAHNGPCARPWPPPGGAGSAAHAQSAVSMPNANLQHIHHKSKPLTQQNLSKHQRSAFYCTGVRESRLEQRKRGHAWGPVQGQWPYTCALPAYMRAAWRPRNSVQSCFEASLRATGPPGLLYSLAECKVRVAVLSTGPLACRSRRKCLPVPERDVMCTATGPLARGMLAA